MNVDKAKADVSLQARFIRKDKKVKEKWSMNKDRGNYHNNGGRDSQNSKNSKFQKGEIRCNKCGGSSNYKGGDNIRR